MSPVLHWLDDEETDLNDYLADPTEPVLCVPSQDNDQFWRMKLQYRESWYGEPGSTMNYWQLNTFSLSAHQPDIRTPWCIHQIQIANLAANGADTM